MTPIFPPLLPWSIPPPKILLNLTHLPKRKTHRPLHLPSSLSRNSEPFSDFIICHTDGSKMHNRVVFTYWQNLRLPPPKYGVHVHCRTSSRILVLHICLIPPSISFQVLLNYLWLPFPINHHFWPLFLSPHSYTDLHSPHNFQIKHTHSFLHVDSGERKVDAAAKAAVNHPRINPHTNCLLNPTLPFSHTVSYIITGPNFGRIESLFLINSHN